MSSICVTTWSKRSWSQKLFCIFNSSANSFNKVDFLVNNFKGCHFVFNPTLNFSFASTLRIAWEHSFLWTLVNLIYHIGWVLVEQYTVSWPLEVHILVLNAILLPILLKLEVLFIIGVSLEITFLTSSKLWIVVCYRQLTLLIKVFHNIINPEMNKPSIVLSLKVYCVIASFEYF